MNKIDVQSQHLQNKYQTNISTLSTTFYANSDQKEKEITWVNGERNGLYKVWYESGDIQREAYFTNDVLNGASTSFYPSG